MSELIDRQAAIRATWQEPSYTDPYNVLTEVRERIEALPTIDAVPVVHGEWFDANYDVEIKFGRHLYLCSVCNKHADSFVGGTEDWWCSRKPNYCPNCGARMGERRENDAVD